MYDVTNNEQFNTDTIYAVFDRIQLGGGDYRFKLYTERVISTNYYNIR